MANLNTVIFGGASNSNGPWPTWVDLVREKYQANFIDSSKKGQGNEAIIIKALHSAWKVKDKSDNIKIIIMLTTIDKWDWYVDKPDLITKYDKEKHNIVRLNTDDQFGFWSTGSWFPLEKEIFKDNFYSEEYFTFRTLQLINMFIQICEKQSWEYNILYDSPIWSVTENTLNQGNDLDIDSNKLVSSNFIKWFYDISNIDSLAYNPGLIGFLYQNNLPWFSNKYGPHPGPKSHYEFTKKYVYPLFDHSYSIIKTQEQLDQFVDRMDSLLT